MSAPKHSPLPFTFIKTVDEFQIKSGTQFITGCYETDNRAVDEQTAIELQFLVRAANKYHEILDILRTIDALCDLVDAGDILDENSPIRDSIRDILKSAEEQNV